MTPPAHASDPVGRSALPSRGRVAIEVRIPSDVRYIEHLVEFVSRQCEAMCFAPRQCALNVPVALAEALSNAILRGNREDAGKQVRLRAELDIRRLVLEVGDEGSGFDMEACQRDPTTPENVLREDGRGLFLMRKLMDHVEQFDNQGNVVRLTLHRT